MPNLMIQGQQKPKGQWRRGGQRRRTRQDTSDKEHGLVHKLVTKAKFLNLVV